MKVVSRLSKVSHGTAEPAEFGATKLLSKGRSTCIRAESGPIIPQRLSSEGRSEGIILILRTFNTANKIKPKRKSLTEGESNPARFPSILLERDGHCDPEAGTRAVV